MPILEVLTRTIGSVKAEGSEHLILNVLEERLTVAELIKRTVEEGIREEVMKRKKNMPQTQDAPSSQEINKRGFLTEAEIAIQRASGMIRFPNQNDNTVPMPDMKAQVQKALRAFESGTYMVLVDNKRVKTLEEVIIFSPTISIQFVRLTPLVGG